MANLLILGYLLAQSSAFSWINLSTPCVPALKQEKV
jgi:hypothetical protein